MNIDKINISAEILFNARKKFERIKKLPENCIPQSINEGYLIQEKLIDKYLSLKKDAKIIGKKVGCTNITAQKQLNVNEPIYGSLFSHFSSQSNCTLNANDFVVRMIEPEFAFKINKTFDIKNAPFTFNEIFSSISSVLPAIEIVDSRFEEWTTIGINNLIADNSVNAYWIYGEENLNINEFDFLNHPVSLSINNKIVQTGNSKNVLGNPINSVVWLINTMASQNKCLPANSYISTGTCTIVEPSHKGDKVCADFGKLGKVNINFN